MQFTNTCYGPQSYLYDCFPAGLNLYKLYVIIIICLCYICDYALSVGKEVASFRNLGQLMGMERMLELYRLAGGMLLVVYVETETNSWNIFLKFYRIVSKVRQVDNQNNSYNSSGMRVSHNYWMLDTIQQS